MKFEIMKKLLFFVLATLVLSSCGPQHPADYLSISGKIENLNVNEVFINGNGIQKRIEIAEDGSFQDSLVIKEEGLHNFYIKNPGKRAILYLKNGYDLKFTGDGSKFFESFVFEGKSEGAQSNNFLTQRFVLGQTAGNVRGFISLDKDAFLKKIDRFKNGMDSITKLYPKANETLVKDSDGQNEKFFANIADNYERMHTLYIQQQEAEARLQKGKPAPDFKDFEDYKGGTKSLDDFKGKFVYIDIWATWCRPCIAQFPYLKKLEEDFKGKNISFVSISTDDNRRSGTWEQAHTKWKDMVKEYNLGGTQLWAGKEQDRFSMNYMANTIPRFILIDPEGNIVNSNEKRPSSPDIKEYFTSLGVK